MGGEVTLACFPFDGRIREAAAVLPRGQNDNLLAPFTLLHDGMTRASTKAATALGHERAIRPRLYCGTNHDNYLQL